MYSSTTKHVLLTMIVLAGLVAPTLGWATPAKSRTWQVHSCVVETVLYPTPLVPFPLTSHSHSQTAAASTRNRSSWSDYGHGCARARGHCTRHTVSAPRHAIARSHSYRAGDACGRSLSQATQCWKGHLSGASIVIASAHGCGRVTWEQWAAHTSTPSDSTQVVVPLGRVWTRSMHWASGQVGCLAFRKR
jgi:hypothetical protein